MAVRGKPGENTGIFRRKPSGSTDEIEHGGSGLSRTLGFWQLTAIGLGAIIGAGIFSLAGDVAHNVAGPAVSISFIIAGIASAAAALSYAEFAGMFPQSGSAYTYGYLALGEIVGWFIGWDLLLEYTAIVAVVAISISGYAGFLLHAVGIDLPTWMLGAPGTGEGHRIDLLAMVLCLLIAFLLNRNIKSSARTETVLVFVKIAIVLAVIVVGAFYFKSDNLSPYMPFGFGATVTGAATVFFAVFGYDAMSTAAEESKNGTRDLPRAIIWSLVIAMVLYLLAATVLTGMQNYTDINPKSAFSAAFASVGLDGFADVIAIGAIVGVATVLFSFMLGASSTPGAAVWSWNVSVAGSGHSARNGCCRELKMCQWSRSSPSRVTSPMSMRTCSSVLPRNSAPRRRRTALEPPSAPITYRASTESPPSIATETPSSSCVSPPTRLDRSTSTPYSARRSRSTSSTLHCGMMRLLA